MFEILEILILSNIKYQTLGESVFK